MITSLILLINGMFTMCMDALVSLTGYLIMNMPLILVTALITSKYTEIKTLKKLIKKL